MYLMEVLYCVAVVLFPFCAALSSPANLPAIPNKWVDQVESVRQFSQSWKWKPLQFIRQGNHTIQHSPRSECTIRLSSIKHFWDEKWVLRCMVWHMGWWGSQTYYSRKKQYFWVCPYINKHPFFMPFALPRHILHFSGQDGHTLA